MPDRTGGIHIGDVGGSVEFHAEGDIVGGDKTIINNIIQRIAKELAATPYKFLASYDITDRDIFHGRNAVIDELAGQVGRTKVLLINGASGSGKTSLVNAGLIPRVADNGYEFAVFREYSDPLAQLRAYFAARSGGEEAPAGGPGEATDEGGLLRLIRAFGKLPVVIFLDQFERFFVRVPEEKRREFIAAFKHCLAHIAATDVCFVFGFRREYLGQLTSEFEAVIPEFLDAARRINLMPLGPAEAREAIVRPLANTRRKIVYDPKFVDEVLLTGLAAQTGGGASIEPPHLQIVCNQLYEAACRIEERDEAALIDAALYDRLGGAETILNTYLDKVVEDVARDPERIPVVHSILKTMVDAGSNTRAFVALEGFRRTLPDVNEAELLKVVEKLLDRRVVEERKPAYSLSHEHMVAKVKEWFDPRELERKRAAETLGRGMMEWKNSGALFNRKQIESVRTWIPEPSDEERELLRASEEHCAELERREAGRKRLKKLSLYGAGAFTALVMALGAYSWVQKVDADRQRNAAVAARNQARANESKALAALARNELATGSPAVAVRVALAASPGIPEGAPGTVGGNAGGNVPGNVLGSGDRPFPPEVEVALYESLSESREVRRLVGHSAAVSSAVFAPDGRRIVTTSRDDTARLWDAATGNEIAALAHGGPVVAAAFSPDGASVVTASSDATARVWNAATGAALVVLRGHDGDLTSAGFAPDGRTIVTASRDGTARVWDAATGKQLSMLRGHGGWVFQATFSPDGRSILTASADRTARLWDAGTGSERAILPHDADVYSAAFSADGRTVVTASRDKTARLWNAATGDALAVLRGHDTDVYAAAFSPDGRTVLTTPHGRDARLWDAATGRETARLRHDDEIYAAAFSPDGRMVATASRDRTVRLWDVATGRELAVLRGHDGDVERVAFSPDGRSIVSASQDGTARIWNVGGGTMRHDGRVFSAVFSPDGETIATASADRTARLWDAASGRERAVLRGHDGDVAAVAFGPDGRTVATASSDRTARLWDVASGKELGVLRGHDGDVSAVAFSPDGRSVATASRDGTARLWDAESGKELAALRGHESDVRGVAFSPDGRTLVTVSRDRTARLWEAAGGKELAVLRGHDGELTSAAFAPDGRTVVTASRDRTARVWDVTTGREIAVLRGHEGEVAFAVFSPDGRLLATASLDRTARVWDPATGRAMAVLAGHEGWVFSVGFSPDGRSLVTASRDRTARLWDVATASPIAVLRHENDVFSAAFSPDGRTVMTTAGDTVRTWPAPPRGAELVAYACSRVPWPLTVDERRRFGIEQEWCTPALAAELETGSSKGGPETRTADLGAAPAR